MAGLYSDISIIAPSSAQAGEIVNVEARIRNLCDFAINLTATVGRVNGEVLRFGAIHKIVGAGETESWYDSFIMPDRDVVVSVESWYKAVDDAWYSDDRAEKAIALEEMPATYHLDVYVPPWATGGYIDPGSGDYPAHSVVTLTAHPLSGYQFVAWGGDASGTDPTYNLYMDSNKYVQAYFEEVPVVVPEPEFAGFSITEYV